MIKIVLLVGLASVGFVLVRRRDTANYAAGKKVLLGLFVILFVISVIFPSITTRAADFVGVGRGADLLLYILVLAFVFVSLNVYLRFRDQRYRLAEVARIIALREGDQRFGRIETRLLTELAKSPSAESRRTDTA